MTFDLAPDPTPSPAAALASDLESPWRRRSSFEPYPPEPSHSLDDGEDADLSVSEV